MGSGARQGQGVGGGRNFDHSVSDPPMPMAHEWIASGGGTFQKDDETAPPGMERRALFLLCDRQERRQWGGQGVGTEGDPVDSVVHRGEFHGIPGCDTDPRGKEVLLGSPSSEENSIGPGSIRKPEHPGPLHFRIRRRLRRPVTAQSPPRREEDEEEASPREGNRPPCPDAAILLQTARAVQPQPPLLRVQTYADTARTWSSVMLVPPLGSMSPGCCSGSGTPLMTVCTIPS